MRGWSISGRCPVRRGGGGRGGGRGRGGGEGRSPTRQPRRRRDRRRRATTPSRLGRRLGAWEVYPKSKGMVPTSWSDRSEPSPLDLYTSPWAGACWVVEKPRRLLDERRRHPHVRLVLDLDLGELPHPGLDAQKAAQELEVPHPAVRPAAAAGDAPHDRVGAQPLLQGWLGLLILWRPWRPPGGPVNIGFPLSLSSVLVFMLGDGNRR
eukprot:gene11878-biopygen5158